MENSSDDNITDPPTDDTGESKVEYVLFTRQKELSIDLQSILRSQRVQHFPNHGRGMGKRRK